MPYYTLWVFSITALGLIARFGFMNKIAPSKPEDLHEFYEARMLLGVGMAAFSFICLLFMGLMWYDKPNLVTKAWPIASAIQFLGWLSYYLYYSWKIERIPEE